jgi:hypothetical protein
MRFKHWLYTWTKADLILIAVFLAVMFMVGLMTNLAREVRDDNQVFIENAAHEITPLANGIPLTGSAPP